MLQWRQVSIVTIQPGKKMGNIKPILIYEGLVAGTDIQYMTRLLQFLHKYWGHCLITRNGQFRPNALFSTTLAKESRPSYLLKTTLYGIKGIN
jgi:hypothetical protein